MQRKIAFIIFIIFCFFAFVGFLVLNYNNPNKIICSDDTRDYEITNYTINYSDSYKPSEPFPPIKYK